MKTNIPRPEASTRAAGLFANLSIQTRLYAGFGMVLVVLAAFATLAITSLRDGARQFDAFAQVTDVTRQAMTIDRDLLWLRRNVVLYAMRGEAETLKNARDAEQKLKVSIARAVAEIKNPTRQKLIQQVSALSSDYTLGFARAVDLKVQITKLRADVMDVAGPKMRNDLSDIIASSMADKDFVGAAHAGLAQQHLMLTRFNANRFLDLDDQAAGEAMKKNLVETLAAVQQLGQEMTDAPRRERSVEVASLLTRYKQAFDEAHGLEVELLTLVNKTMAGQAQQIADAAAAIVASSTQDLEKTHHVTVAELNNTILVSQILAAVAIGVGLLLAWLIGRGIVRPIGGMTAAMGILAQGNKQAAIPAQERGDEIGAMARSVEAFRLGLIRADELEAESKRLAHEAEALARKTAEEQAVVITTVDAALTAMADGDLTARIEIDFAPAYDRLRLSVNMAIDRLAEVVGAVGEAARTIGASTGEVAQASDDLSARTQQQAANLEETAAASEELASSVKKTAETARQAEARTASARSTAEAGGRIANDTASAMGKIERSSNEMSAIVDTIQEIAFQTNLLALNAGVEAARAGEAGMGFAVVATEVRALAQRCGEAAKQIRELIATSETLVADGVKLVGASGESLKEIVASVAEITLLVQQISGACQEQSSGISETTTALANIDQSTQQNAAMVEETTTAAGTLAGEAGRLVELVNRFKLDAGRGSHRAPSQIPRSPKMPATRPAVVSRAPANERAAPLALASGDNWREF